MPNELNDYSGAFIPDLKLEDFSPGTLAGLLKMYARIFFALDGIWYRRVQERFGSEAALACDKTAWEDIVKYEVATIKRQLRIKGSDLASLMKVTQLCPWFNLTESSIQIDGNSQATLTVHHCPILDSLENKTDGAEYRTCTVVCPNINRTIASLFNPHIKVFCLKSPPRENKSGICCRWQFIMTG